MDAIQDAFSDWHTIVARAKRGQPEHPYIQ